MATTPVLSFRYPVLSDAPNGPVAFENLAKDVEAEFGRRGVIARHRRTTTSVGITATTPATATGLMRVSASLKKDRLYRVGLNAMASYGDAYSRGQATLNYTTNGSNPTTSSTMLTQSGCEHANVGSVEFYPLNALYVPGSDQTFTVTVFMFRPVGTASIYAYAAAATPLDLMIEDLGIDPGASGTNL